MRRLVKRSYLLDESDWEKVHFFDFAVEEILSIPDFMQKNEFRAKALKVDKSETDMERDRGRTRRLTLMFALLWGRHFIPFLTGGCSILSTLQNIYWRHPTFKSDLVIGLACFDYNVFFLLPKTQAIECYWHIYRSFSSRGWLARELQNLHMNDYVDFVDEIRHIAWVNWKVDQLLVSFLSSRPGLGQRKYMHHVFRLCCLCLSHVVPNLP